MAVHTSNQPGLVSRVRTMAAGRQVDVAQPGGIHLGAYRSLPAVVEAVAQCVAAAVDLVAAPSRDRRLRAAVAAGPAQVAFGAGPVAVDGWISTDVRRRHEHVYYCDLRRRLPFADGSLVGIVAEHVLEHLYLDDTLRAIGEFGRVLRPGGLIRLAAPDGEFLAKLVAGTGGEDARAQVELEERLHNWPADGLGRWRAVNRLAYQFGEHRSLLTPSLVEDLLRRAGFRRVVHCAADESPLFGTNPGTHHIRFPDALDGFTLEAER
jgi:predicted SAM-dependent methyltransferase